MPNDYQERMAQAAEQLTEALLQCEEAFVNRPDIDVAARVEISDLPSHVRGPHQRMPLTYLWFMPGEDGEWGFWVEVPDTKQPFRELYSASLEVRLNAAKKIPHLLKAILDEKKAIASGVYESIERLNRFNTALKAAIDEGGGAVQKFVDEIPEKWATPVKEENMANLGPCLGCSDKPAVCKDGTVPLCAGCYQQAKGSARGVKMNNGPKVEHKVRRGQSARPS